MITGFGGASLAQAITDIVRVSPDAEYTIITARPRREHALRKILEAEGLGDTRTTTFTGFAEELIRQFGSGAIPEAAKMLLFLRALKDADLPGEWRAYTGTAQGAQTLFDILDSLRSASLRSADLAKLKGKPPAANSLAKLLKNYEQLLREGKFFDNHDLIEKAADAVQAGQAVLTRRYLFDCIHDAAPDEFRLAVAIAQADIDCVFLCDPSAPPPPARAVIIRTDRELAANLPDLKSKTAPRPPGYELGRSIAEGSLEGKSELLQFNDFASECRGLARRARDIELEEGLSEKDIAFFFQDWSVQADLLRYELQRADLLTEDMPAHPARTALLREMRLITDLLAEPDRMDPRARIVSAGLAADESQLEGLLASILPRRETDSLPELIANAIESLLPATSAAQKEALDRYIETARLFNDFFAPGAGPAALRDFASAVDLLQTKAWPGDLLPRAFLSPDAPPARFYDTVFLPCLLSETRTGAPLPPGIRELMPGFSHLLPGPVQLPDVASAQLRERWEAGSAAASAARVIMSFHRQSSGRHIEPAIWLRDKAGSARPGPEAACSGPRRPLPAKPVADRVPVPQVLSVTSIKQYSTCPHRFFLNRILQIAPPPSERMKLGSLIHRVLARFHSPGETDFSPERLAHLLAEETERETLLPASQEEAQTLLSAYAADATTGSRRTLKTEHSFRMDFAGTRVSGRIDRIVAAPGGIRIIDYKISGSGKVRKHRNAVMDRLDDVQLPLYVLAAREAGMKVACFSYLYLNYEGTGRPAEVTLRLDESDAQDSIGEAALQQSLERIENVVAEILAGKETYERGENAPCRESPARCDYAAMCPLMTS